MTENRNKRMTSPTRARILEAAGAVFARRGYLGATTEDICRQANVNIASICYYFGGKENLYRAAWEHLMARDEEELGGLMSAPLPPDDKLLAYLRLSLSRLLSADDNSRRLQLLAYREMASPSPINQEIFDKYLLPARHQFIGLLDNFFGRRCPPTLVNQCFLCLQSAFFWLIDIQERNTPNSKNLKEYLNDSSSADELAENLLTYTMGGMRALKASLPPLRPDDKA